MVQMTADRSAHMVEAIRPTETTSSETHFVDVPQDKYQPYEHITQVNIGQTESTGYYLTLGQHIPAPSWGNAEETPIKSVAKIYLTPHTLRLLAGALQDALHPESEEASE